MLFCAAAVLYGAWLIWRTFLPLEIDYDEAWNAWQAQAAMGAGALYPAPGALIANNYPPLSFYILGAAAKLTGIDPILTGRLASLLGLGASAAAVAVLVRQLGGSRAAAGLGAAWYLATMVRFCSGYVGMNDPTLLALAVMAWALVLFIRGQLTGRPTDAAIVLMLAAGFMKHSLLATPVAALLWVWLEGDRRAAARATAVGALGAAIGLGLCTATFGQAFLEQLFLYRRHMAILLVLGAMAQLARQAGLALVLGLVATRRGRSPGQRFMFIYLVAGLVVVAVTRAGQGVDINAGFELILAAAIGLGLFLDAPVATGLAKSLRPEAVRWAVVAALAATLTLSTNPRPYAFWTSPEFHRRTALQIREAEAEVARVRAHPGPVWCPVGSVCFRAGKDFVYDSFAMDQRVATGLWSKARLDQARAAAGIRTEAGTEIGAWPSLVRSRSRTPR